MKFIYLLSFSYLFFMVAYGFWAAYMEVTPDQPPEPPLNDPIHIELPLAVSKMEWTVNRNKATLLSVEDINNNPINLDI